MNRKYLIPLFASITFIGGTVFIVLPFIPLGWFLYAVTILLLIPYFKTFQRAFEWLTRKDNTGFTRRALRFTARIYRWARDEKNADLFDKMSDEKNGKSHPENY